MALLTGIIDRNPQRSALFLAGSRGLAPPLPWLTNTTKQIGRLDLSLTGSPTAPFSTHQDQAGRAFFILGDVLSDARGSNAAQLGAQCLAHGPEMLARQNGYYLAGMLDEHDTIYLAADQLGLMPLYYWVGPEHFCFSTSPNAFRSHPDFNPKPDLAGIAGILLTMHATGDHTIWDGVKRLPPGHLLRWREGEGLRLTAVNTLTAHDDYFGWPLSRCQRLIENSLNEAVKRLENLGETSLLLSGGLDSRLVAGSLRWHAKYKVPVITLGEAQDYEMQCARGVAKRCGWSMHTVDVDLDAYPTWAPVQVRLEGMQHSFVNLMWWQALDTVQRQKARIMTGFMGDAVMGGSQIEYAFNRQTDEYDFETQFARVNHYGFAPETVSRLLGEPDLGESVVRQLKDAWISYDGYAFQKSWLFSLHHRQRLHIGANAWRLAFGAWQSSPYVDQDLLRVMAGMAAPTFAERRAQNTMLCSKFPKLAALPLDRGGPNMRPLQANSAWKLKSQIMSPLHSLLDVGHKIERRQYVRHYDINNPGWHAIRQISERHREALGAIFDMQTLNEILPPPLDTPLATPDPIVDGSRYKTLLGLFMQFGSDGPAPTIIG